MISPLLSNIYLHYVLDEWFSEQIQPLLKGKSFIVRYADDFVLGFSDKSDAERVMAVLPKRFAKYELTLYAEKTKLIDLKRKTSSKRLTRAIMNVSNYIQRNRHMKLKDLIAALNVKLRGHYNYYGVTFNSRSLYGFFMAVRNRLFKWLNRRGGKVKLNWDKFSGYVDKSTPLVKPFIKHSYVSLSRT